MAMNDDWSAESPQNYEQKCLCVLVLDVSGSMHGEPIDELNRGLQDFHREIQEDDTTANRLEICVVEFSSNAECIQEPALAYDFDMPALAVKGSTRMVDGVRLGIDRINARKDWYKETGQPYYRPWVILITDGYPDGDQDVDGLASQIQQDTANKSYVFFAVGVKGADMQILARLSNEDMPPAPLAGLKFAEFFRWLSNSMNAITHSSDGEKIALPKPTDWMDGYDV